MHAAESIRKPSSVCRHVLACVPAVTAQGRTLKVKNMAKHYAWRFDDGAYIQTTWERYKPGLDNTVTIETGALQICI